MIADRERRILLGAWAVAPLASEWIHQAGLAIRAEIPDVVLLDIVARASGKIWAAVKEYYDTRAPEYDEWYLGLGRFADIDRPEWDDDVARLISAIGRLPPARTLDVACGTGFLTRHLSGEIIGLDQSERMLQIARGRLPNAEFVRGDALSVPFAEDSFGRVFTAHFYGHLDRVQREAFLTEAHRLAPELVVVDSALRPDRQPEEWQERILNDGSRFEVYKRYFDADELARELGGGAVLHKSRWFVAVAAGHRSDG